MDRYSLRKERKKNNITQLFVGDPVPDKSRYERQKLFGRCRR